MSSAADVLGKSVVRGMRGVGGVCELCMCLARGGVWGVWMRGLAFSNSVGTEGVLDVCLGFGGVGGSGLGSWSGGVVLWSV